jgi:AbrB family looped-hinge helix DNA binding protein
MEAVTISPKFQIVIPRKIRDFLKLKPGLKVQVMVYGDRIELIPLKKISDMRGFLEGISTEVDREPDRI